MKKTSIAFKRLLSLVLVVLMVLTNIPVTALAATPGFTIEPYTYDYDTERARMINHSAFRALLYIGYDSGHRLGNAGELFEKTRGEVAAEDRTKVPYSESQDSKGREKCDINVGYFDAVSYTGKYPHVKVFETGLGNPAEKGLDCVDYVEYYLFNYMPNIEGADISLLTNILSKYPGYTGDNMDFWPKAKEDFIEAGVQVWSVDPNDFDVSYYTDEDGLKLEYKKIKKYTDPEGNVCTDDIYKKLPIGTIIQMGNGEDSTIHYAVYAGTYNGKHFIYHSGNIDRGPEIAEVEDLWTYGTTKQSVPLNFYSFPFVPDENEDYGSIEVYKTDEEGNPLAGAKFLILNTETGENWDITTDETGYAMQDELPLGTYTVKELIPPMGYKLVDTVWTITLTKKDPTGGGTIHVTNKLLTGSLKIQKLILPTSMSTPENLAGWKFKVLNKKGMTVGTYTTGTEGFVQVNDLPIGTYYVQEVDTDKEDWEYDTEQKTVEVTAGHTAEAPAVVSFSNQYL